MPKYWTIFPRRFDAIFSTNNKKRPHEGSLLTNFRVINSLFEEFAMAAETHQIYFIAVLPYQQEIRLYVTFHASCIVSDKRMGTILLRYRHIIFEHLQDGFQCLHLARMIAYSLKVFLELGRGLKCCHALQHHKELTKASKFRISNTSVHLPLRTSSIAASVSAFGS